MQNLLGSLGLTPPVTIQLDLRGPDGRPPPTVGGGKSGTSPSPSSASTSDAGLVAEAGGEAMPLYTNHATVAGQVKIAPQPGRRLEHAGIKIQLIGRIELAADRGTKHDFLKLVRDLAPPGDLSTPLTFPFSFTAVELEHETYAGAAARLRYLLRVSITRPYAPTLAREWGLCVRNPSGPPPPPPPALPPAEAAPPASDPAADPTAGVPGTPGAPEGPDPGTSRMSRIVNAPTQAPVKMEVGIEDCLHIEVEYDSPAYPLDGVVTGSVAFLLVRIRLKHMELELRRRETAGGGAAARSEAVTLGRFELMDGAPARGEAVPIRLHLGAYENLTPTYIDVHNRFSVRYFLNLVLVDEEERRYFKSAEIVIYRGQNDGAGGVPLGMLPRPGGPPTPAAAARAAAPAASAAAGPPPVVEPLFAEEEEEAPPPAPAVLPAVVGEESGDGAGAEG